MAEPAAQRQHAAVGIDRHLHVPVLVALADGGDEILAAVLHPFQRPAQQQRRGRQRQLLGMERRLRPEAAAGVGRHHADALLADAERRHQDLLGAMRRLGVGVDRQRVVDRIDAHRDAARLDRMAAALVQAEALLDAMRRLGERAVDVAVVDALSRDEIVRAIEPGLGRAGLKSGDRIDHRRQLFEIERDQGERVLGDAAAVGHHHRHRLADVGDLVLRQHIRIDVEADRAGRQRLRDAVARSAAAGDRRRSAPRARREGPSPRSRRCPSIGHAPPGCAGTRHAARRGYPDRRRSGPGRATAARPRRASCGGRTTMLVPPSPWCRCRNYDALRNAAPPPRKPSRIATARFMENSRVF